MMLEEWVTRHWTDRLYFEVCADPAVYSALPGGAAEARG